MLLGTHEHINQLARIYNVPIYTGKMIAELADNAEAYCAFGFGYTGSVLYAATQAGLMPLCYVTDACMAHELCKVLSDYVFGEFRHSKSNHERLERALSSAWKEGNMTNEKRVQLIQLCILSAMEFMENETGLSLQQDSMHLFVAWHTLHTSGARFDASDYELFPVAIGRLLMRKIILSYLDEHGNVSYCLRAEQKTRDNYRISLLN